MADLPAIPSRDQLGAAKRPKVDLFAARQAARAAAAAATAGSIVSPGPACATPSSNAVPALPVPDVLPQLQPAPPASFPSGGSRLFPAPPDVGRQQLQIPLSASASGSQPPPLPPPISDKILVSKRQKGNRVIDCIQNVGWAWADIVPDYQLGQSTVALFLSLRYHLLHPQYILRRVEELNRAFTLCVILVLVDMEDHQRPIQEVTRAMFSNRCTVVLAWSNLEAARYLETLKAYQSKPADMLQQRPTGDYTSALNDCLSAIRAINKSDVLTLSTSLGSLRNILLASEDQLALCPGLGEKKIRLLQSAVNDPFVIPAQAARVAVSGDTALPGAAQPTVHRNKPSGEP